MIPPKPSIDMDQLLGRFLGDAALISHLLVESDAFRHMCEDFILAKGTLKRLESVQQEAQAARITEYREIIAELEREITEALAHARPRL